MKLGVIAEDSRDCEAYAEFARKIRTDIEHVYPVPCGGVANLKKEFVGYLRYFEYRTEGVDKVLVIRDSDCGDAAQREQELLEILNNSHYHPPFPVHFYATKCELETWLLADEAAINLVAAKRGKARTIKPIKINFESHKEAKELFLQTLSKVSLPADPAVYREISEVIDIARVRSKCPRFKEFALAVNGC